MKKIYFSAFIFALLATAGMTTEARAQYIGTSPFIRYSNNIFVNSNMHLFFQKRWQIARLRAQGKHQVADAMEGRRATAPVKTGSNLAKPPAEENPLRRVPLLMSSYKPVAPNLAPEIMTANLEGLSAQDRSDAQKLFVALLKSYDDLLVSGKETRLRNNVAGATAFAILTSRYILTGTELTETQAEALLQDINALLASAVKFKTLPARERQIMSETLVITGGLALTLYRQGLEEGNAEKQEQGRDLARTILSQFFDRPVGEIDFTDSGVEFGN